MGVLRKPDRWSDLQCWRNVLYRWYPFRWKGDPRDLFTPSLPTSEESTCETCGNAPQSTLMETDAVHNLRAAYSALFKAEGADYPVALAQFRKALPSASELSLPILFAAQVQYGLTICKAAGGGPLSRLDSGQLGRMREALEKAQATYSGLTGVSSKSPKDHLSSIKFNLRELSDLAIQHAPALNRGQNGPDGRDPLHGAGIGPHQFQAIVDLHIKYPQTTQDLVIAGEYGLMCLRCETGIDFPPCPNCGHPAYRFGVSTERVVGLFCRECNRGFTHKTCPMCRAENPITYATLAKRHVPTPINERKRFSVGARLLFTIICICGLLSGFHRSFERPRSRSAATRRACFSGRPRGGHRYISPIATRRTAEALEAARIIRAKPQVIGPDL